MISGLTNRIPRSRSFLCVVSLSSSDYYKFRFVKLPHLIYMENVQVDRALCMTEIEFCSYTMDLGEYFLIFFYSFFFWLCQRKSKICSYNLVLKKSVTIEKREAKINESTGAGGR